MLTIGLTGGIATGKSAVAALLNQRPHISVLDADDIAKEVVQSGTKTLTEIFTCFGPEVFDAEGALDRDALGKRVMSDPAARAQLEGITHPRIRAAILEGLIALADGGAKIAVVEAALLVETGSHRAYDQLWVVTCSPAIQLERLVKRKNCTEEEAQKWISAQLPLEKKIALADVILENNGSLQDLKALVDRSLQSLDIG